MYEKHYGFIDKPFNMTPDSAFFYASSKHEEALNRLLLAISERNGFAIITGEIGSGKTTISRALLNKLDPMTKVALVLNTHLGKKELLTTILEDLGVEYKSTSKTHLLSALNKYLIEQATKDVNVVLILDEAQNLTPSVLEEVRMLSNLETEKEKLIQIILLGQPQLREKISSPKLEQFSQRIVLYYHLEPLSYNETKSYIQYRLKKAGNADGDIFTSDAVHEIYKYSNGIPRLINLACHNALISGLVANLKRINGKVVREAVGDLTHHRGYAPLPNMIEQNSLSDAVTPIPNDEPLETDTPLTLNMDVHKEEIDTEPLSTQETIPTEKLEASLSEKIPEETSVSVSSAIPEEESPKEDDIKVEEIIAPLLDDNTKYEVSPEPHKEATPPSKRRFPIFFILLPFLLITPIIIYFILSPKILRKKTVKALPTDTRSYEKLISNGALNADLIKNAAYKKHASNNDLLLGKSINLADTKTPHWTRITLDLANQIDLSKANLLIRAKSTFLATSISLRLTDLKGNTHTSLLMLSPRWEYKNITFQDGDSFDLTKVTNISIEHEHETENANNVHIKEIGIRNFQYKQ